MKKKLIIFIPILIIVGYFSFTILFSGKSENSNGLNVIPTNTPAVGIISVGEIINKMAYEKLEKLDLESIQFMIDERDQLIKDFKSGPNKSELAVRFLENPFDGFGFNLNQDIFFFALINKNSAPYVCISGGVSDKEEVENVIKEFKKTTISPRENSFKIRKKDDYNIATYYDRDAAVALAWDDTKFLFIATTDGRARKSDIKIISNEVARLFNLDSKDKINSIDSFNTFYKENTDMCFWASAEGMDKKYLNNMIDPQFNKILKGAGIKINDLLETSYTGFFDFNDDYISIKTSLRVNDEIKEIVKDRLGPETSEFSMELKMKFDESGENSLFAILKTMLIAGDYLMTSKSEYDMYDYDYYDNYYDDYDTETETEYEDEYYEDYGDEYYEGYGDEYYEGYGDEYYEDYGDEYYEGYGDEYYEDYGDEYYEDYGDEYYEDYGDYDYY